MNRTLLSEGLSMLGLEGSVTDLEKLERYYRELELWNPKYGLVRASGDELLIKHFLDSLAGLMVIRSLAEPLDLQGGSGICDVGSGAGFPGIPLAVCMPGTLVTLVESSGRRVSFLRNVVSLLRLSNVRIEESRAEEVAPASAERGSGGSAGTFSVITCRAFRPLTPEILAVLSRLKTENGWIAAYKGKQERIEEELEQVTGMFTEVRLVPLPVPFLEEERHLLLLR